MFGRKEAERIARERDEEATRRRHREAERSSSDALVLGFATMSLLGSAPAVPVSSCDSCSSSSDSSSGSYSGDE